VVNGCASPTFGTYRRRGAAALLPCSLEEGVVAAERVREVRGPGNADETAGRSPSASAAGGPAGTELEVLLPRQIPCSISQTRRPHRVEAVEESCRAGKLAAQDRAFRVNRGNGGYATRVSAGGNLRLLFHRYHAGHEYSPSHRANAALMSLRSRSRIARGGFACLFSTSTNTRRR
jgi:hypothetical protein